jgi:DNA-binding response OmpR family regulator
VVTCSLHRRRGNIRVLIVEDEVDLARTIAKGLRAAGMAPDVANDGNEALEKAYVNAYDVVVLDRDLPGVHGDDVCRELTAGDRAPRVLMLTASGGIEQRVHGLSIGADDYLPKPFDFQELVARIRALGRRPEQRVGTVLSARDLTFDVARRHVRRAGRDIALTAKEYGVLEILLASDGAVVSAEELLEKAWDEHADPFTAAVRVTIANLRRKLGEPPLIETVIGAGYRILR